MRHTPPGVPYKGDYGFRQEYFQTYRLTTQYLRAVRMIKELHRNVWQYRIKLTDRERSRLLLIMLKISTAVDPNERYHTTRNNCVLTLFNPLDKAVPPPWYRKPLLLITDNTLFIPTRAPEHLRYRGLAARNEADFHLPNLETELGWEQYVDNRTKSK